jgi:hypothetical protein
MTLHEKQQLHSLRTAAQETFLSFSLQHQNLSNPFITCSIGNPTFSVIAASAEGSQLSLVAAPEIPLQ